MAFDGENAFLGSSPPDNIVERGENLTFPDSAVSYFKGMMGQPRWGFPKELQRVVLRGEEPVTCRPGELLPPMDFEAARERLKQFVPEPDWRPQDVEFKCTCSRERCADALKTLPDKSSSS